MIKKLLILIALSTSSTVASAQWIFSSEHAGDFDFSEKTAGVYELSLPGDTIYGRFLLKNGEETRYGAENTFVCGGVPYTFATEGDSLMLASPLVSPVLTLDVNNSTLTATGDMQPLTVRGNIAGAYWNPFVMEPLDYEGNGVYKCHDLQMIGSDFTICMMTAPKTLGFDEGASWLIPYRFSGKSVTGTNRLEYGVAEEIYIAERGASVNLYLPQYYAKVDITVDLKATPTIVATGGYAPPQMNLYMIGSNVALGGEIVKWNDNGCTKGFELTREEDEETQNVTYTIKGVQVRATENAEDSEPPMGQVEFVSDLGTWADIQGGSCFGWEREVKIMTLNSNDSCSTSLRDAGDLATSLSLPTGTYDISLLFSSTAEPIMMAKRVDVAAVGEINADEAEELPIEWFDIEGKRVSAPAKNGIYIRRHGRIVQKLIVR